MGTCTQFTLSSHLVLFLENCQGHFFAQNKNWQLLIVSLVANLLYKECRQLPIWFIQPRKISTLPIARVVDNSRRFVSLQQMLLCARVFLANAEKKIKPILKQERKTFIRSEADLVYGI